MYVYLLGHIRISIFFTYMYTYVYVMYVYVHECVCSSRMYTDGEEENLATLDPEDDWEILARD